MPAGAFPAGAGLGGTDPVIAAGPLAPARPPQALRFNGQTKDYFFENGRHVEVHWVDAAMFDLLRVATNSILSAPNSGNQSWNLERLDKRRLQAQVEDFVAQAVTPLTSRGVARVIGVEIDLSVYARLAYRVNYENLVLRGDARLQASASPELPEAIGGFLTLDNSGFIQVDGFGFIQVG